MSGHQAGIPRSPALLVILLAILVVSVTSCGEEEKGARSVPIDPASDIAFEPVTDAPSYVGIVSDDAPTAEIATTQEQLAALWKQHLDEDTPPQLPEGHTFLFVWSPEELLEVKGVSSGPDGVVVASESVTWIDDETCSTFEDRGESPSPWVAVVDVGEQLSGEVRLNVRQVQRSC